MRLRTLLEALGNEVAIIFGRFNPPHKGHRAAWELASKSPVWFVGTNQSTVGPKDPLPYDVKIEAMKTIWPEVEGHIMAETSWLTMASKIYEEYPNATLLCFTDEDWVTKTIQQYNGKEGAHGYYNFPKIEQKATPRLSSATALRDAVIKGDRNAFTQAAGVDADTEVAGKPFFDLVAEYLLPYQNAPKKAPAKKKKEPEVAENLEELKTKDSRPVDNFTIDDIKALEKENDIEALKVRAKQLINRGSQKRMKPEKISWFINHIDTLRNKTAIVKLMYDLYLAGEGHKVIGSRYSMNPNSYRQRFGDDINSTEDAAGVGIITKQNTTKDVNKGTLSKMMRAFHLIDNMYKEFVSITEAPIELDPADPMDPMIYGAGANPAKLKYRMLRAANQLKDLAQRSQSAGHGEWDTITKQFDELTMNINQIKHGIEELRKMRSRGGVRSRGIEKF